MEPRGASGGHGLWKNIKCVQAFTHWSRSDIADQVLYYAGTMDRKRLHHALSLVIERRQLRWKYAPALAHAWGIRELELLHGDFTTCATLEELERKYGFNLDDIIGRWEEHREQDAETARSLKVIDWLRKFRTPGDDDD
ncbi:hypothetical protein F6X37_06335 [Paraburkholderia sp. 31.1]|uniref:hypothetical protein n=1 Tax=Paraburkholderia sp. 31.1 TaxID=2615205 RepID=UPI0016559984|nr:hypothetical protein [Paraburkholderia sp. 31.1]MBC8721228.1 hypothetical protein [Paraburkholderia sp. 31.1]